MKSLSYVLLVFSIVLLAGCSPTEKEKIVSAKSMSKSQHLYKWSGTKKDNETLVQSAVKHFYTNLEDAFNSKNVKELNSSVLRDSKAYKQLKTDIESGKFGSMKVYSYAVSQIGQVDKHYVALVGREISDSSTSGKVYEELAYQFTYDASLKQMMISDILSAKDSGLKKDSKDKAGGVSIDILSTQFQNNYMIDQSRFYGGINEGMSYEIIKEQFGDFSDHFKLNGDKYYVYGNAGIKYNKEITEDATGNETVEDMVIVPNQLMYQDVLAFYGYPKVEKLDNTNDPHVLYTSTGSDAKLAFHLSTDKKVVEYIEKLK